MTVSLALNSGNDIFADKGRIARVKDGGQVVQDCRSRLLLYYSEWFLDIEAGVPYFDDVFDRPIDLGRIESTLKSVVINTKGVSELVYFDLEFDGEDRINRKLKVTFQVNTIYGDNNSTTVNIL